MPLAVIAGKQKHRDPVTQAKPKSKVTGKAGRGT